MNAIKSLWTSIKGLSAALDRLTGLAHEAADAIESRVELVAPAAEQITNGRRTRQTVSKA